MFKVKGSICKVPSNRASICNESPPGLDSSNLIFVKLTGKLEYSGHKYFELIHPSKVIKYLKFLS